MDGQAGVDVSIESGAPVDAAAAADRLLDEVVSGRFSMRAKDISSFIDGGPKPTVETVGTMVLFEVTSAAKSTATTRHLIAEEDCE